MLDQRAMLSSASSKNSNISGTFRFKYFEKPILPFVEYNKPEIVLDKTMIFQQMGNDDDQSCVEACTPYTRPKSFRSSGTQSEPHPTFQLGDRILSPKNLAMANDYNHPNYVLQRQKRKAERRKKLPPIVNKETLRQYQNFLDEEEQKEFERIKEHMARKKICDEQMIQERVEVNILKNIQNFTRMQPFRASFALKFTNVNVAFSLKTPHSLYYRQIVLSKTKCTKERSQRTVK